MPAQVRVFSRAVRLSPPSRARVVGDAAPWREAVEVARRLSPDVVLIDLHMPGGSGVEAIRELRRACPDARCLVLTMDDDDSLFSAMRAGAR